MPLITLDRRRFLRNSVALSGVALAAPAIATRALARDRELVVSSWGGAYQAALRRAFFDPFEQETGIRVIDTSAPTVAQVRAQVDSGNVEWDVIEGGSRWYPVLVEFGLVQELDLSRLDTSLLVESAVRSHGVAPTLVSMALGFNTSETGGNHPSNWAEFWDVERFPGARSLGADVTYNLEFALLADGVAPEDLYPIDVDRAFAKLEQIRPHIRTWWEQGDQPIQMLARGEVLYSSGWSARLLAAELQGEPISLSWGQASFSPSFFMIMSGAPHTDAAYEFIDFSNRADRQADMAQQIPVGVSNTDAAAMIPEERERILPTSEANFAQQWALQGEWLATNFDAINDRWQRFLLG
ncbi:MAG: ABC transporter substrate-binding protein [Alkalilacustris sp.]